jgi:hypothetical protein
VNDALAMSILAIEVRLLAGSCQTRSIPGIGPLPVSRQGPLPGSLLHQLRSYHDPFAPFFWHSPLSVADWNCDAESCVSA